MGPVRDDTVIARRVSVHGRVQGVCFRDSCRREAERRGVAGWVGNEPDGSVSALFEGTGDVVDAMVDWARTGPARATVERVDVDDVDPRGVTGFRVR